MCPTSPRSLVNPDERSLPKGATTAHRAIITVVVTPLGAALIDAQSLV